MGMSIACTEELGQALGQVLGGAFISSLSVLLCLV